MEYIYLLLFISVLNIIGTLTLKTGRCLNYSVDGYYEAKERIKDIIEKTNDQDAFILIDVAFALIFLPSFLYFLLTIIVIKNNIILILAIVYLCEKILRISAAKSFIKEGNVPYNYAWNVFNYVINLVFSFNVAHYCTSILNS